MFFILRRDGFMGLFNDVWEQTKAEQEEKQKRKK